MYSDQLVLNGNGCEGQYHYIYPQAIFDTDGLQVQDSTTPVSSPFGVTLFCADNTSGSGFDPNIQFAGLAAIIPPGGAADLKSCYSRIVHSPYSEGMIKFVTQGGPTLRKGMQLCILMDSRLAVVTLHSVSETDFDLDGSVTVWQVING
jgi:hypothetical protein